MLVYWFLPMVLFLGIITSYEDIKFGKIRNKWILVAIVYSIIASSILFSLNYYDTNYLIKILANGLFSIIFGFAIWYANLWTAGDAKLFFAFTILMPIHKPHSYFFFLTYLSNTFIPLSIILLFYILFKAGKKKKLFYLKKTFSIKIIFRLIPFIFGFSWIIGLLLGIAGLGSNLVLSFAGIFLLYYIFDAVLKIKILYIGLLLSLARLIFDKSIYSPQFVSQFLLLTFLFMLVRVFLFSVGSGYLSKEIKLNDLEKGMIPAEIIIKINGKYAKRMKSFSLIGSIWHNKIGKPLFRNLARGLSNKDILKLKSLQKKLPFKTLRIQTTMPFAPFLSLGALLTIISQGNFIGLFF
ncbi:hypothetical protein HYW20_06730 [Candidatus Woesearchaeota archaeon]|nr:hypothetical protein [Candidatus Woesearchaeota archaeon]